jgi:hypothetical protein
LLVGRLILDWISHADWPSLSSVSRIILTFFDWLVVLHENYTQFFTFKSTRNSPALQLLGSHYSRVRKKLQSAECLSNVIRTEFPTCLHKALDWILLDSWEFFDRTWSLVQNCSWIHVISRTTSIPSYQPAPLLSLASSTLFAGVLLGVIEQTLIYCSVPRYTQLYHTPIFHTQLYSYFHHSSFQYWSSHHDLQHSFRYGLLSRLVDNCHICMYIVTTKDVFVRQVISLDFESIHLL